VTCGLVVPDCCVGGQAAQLVLPAAAADHARNEAFAAIVDLGSEPSRQMMNTPETFPQVRSSIGLDCAVFYVPANTVYVIWERVFTGQKTQPTVSKY